MTRRPRSLRNQLLWGILLPVLGLVALNAALLYRQALDAADIAYDRTLLASAKAIGELLTVVEAPEPGPVPDIRVQATMPYSALEAFEADNRSRLYYRINGFQGEVVSGFADLPAWQDLPAEEGPYAALVTFHDARYRDEPVRMAVLRQPVAGPAGQGMATIQVAETLELRHTLARQILLDTLWRQALLVAVIGIVVVVVVQRVTRPVRSLSEGLGERRLDGLEPIAAPDAPRELQPLVAAANRLVDRLRAQIDDQRRFVRDTSHQLRTPLAVLRTQVQSAQRGDVDPRTALQEIGQTVERATELANQMLALAKSEQLRDAARRDDAASGPPAPRQDWAEVLRQVALDLAPLIADRGLDFDIRTEPCPVRGHVWALRELTRNLMHNAIRFSPPGAALTVVLQVIDEPPPTGRAEAGADPDWPWHGVRPTPGPRARLCIADAGPGLDPALRPRLFQPFSAGDAGSGSGLGLAICLGIVEAAGGRIALVDRRPPLASPTPTGGGRDASAWVLGDGPGLAAMVEWPLDPSPPEPRTLAATTPLRTAASLPPRSARPLGRALGDG